MWMGDCRTKCGMLLFSRKSWNEARCVVQSFELPSTVPVDSTSWGSDYVMSRFLANFGDLTGLSCTKHLGLCLDLEAPLHFSTIVSSLLLLLVAR